MLSTTAFVIRERPEGVGGVFTIRAQYPTFDRRIHLEPVPLHSGVVRVVAFPVPLCAAPLRANGSSVKRNGAFVAASYEGE